MEQRMQVLNSLLAVSGAHQLVDLKMDRFCEEAPATVAITATALSSSGQLVRISLQYFSADSSQQWSPTAWVGAERVDQSHMIFQFVDFFCTRNDHAHSVYRFFGKRGKYDARCAANLEVHVVELPKWEQVGHVQDHATKETIYAFADWLRKQGEVSQYDRTLDFINYGKIIGSEDISAFTESTVAYP